MASKRQSVLVALVDRLSVITVDGGFETDAGRQVFINESPDLGPDDPVTAVAIVSREDVATWQGGKLLIRWPVEFHALAKVTDPQEAWRASIEAEAVAADIKRAIELDDRTIGGLLVNRGLERTTTRILPREPGGTTVGAAVGYVLELTETWGNP